MKFNKIIKRSSWGALLLLAVTLPTSCESFLETNPVDSLIDDDRLQANNTYAEGILLDVYHNIQNPLYSNENYACDDAVNQVATHNTYQMCNGGWTSRMNPVGYYDNAYTSIAYINKFLSLVDNVMWHTDPDTNTKFINKLKGEAYGLRAYFSELLLRKNSGYSASGELLGYPIVNEVITDAEAAKRPRDSYKKCVAQIFADCDAATSLLPDYWIGNEVDGERNHNRITGLAVKVIKSRVALYATSPAFIKDSGVTAEDALEICAAPISANKYFTRVSDKDTEFYLYAGDNTYLSSYSELLWYSSKADSNAPEKSFMPATEYGSGTMNPSLDFVKTFGRADGTPFQEGDDLFAGRDPRFEKYIFHNGSVYNRGGVDFIINIGTGSENAVGATKGTQTGFFMRKWLNPCNVSLVSGSEYSAPRVNSYIRYTEAMLNFAEAANNVGGPDQAVGGYSARQAINAIRTRAGIAEDYANSITDKDEFMTLIINERRIELSFEGHRFWDVRRWMLSDEVINSPITGVKYSSETDLKGEEFTVANRNFDLSYQYYAPIPYNETVKYDIEQNKGW